MDLFEEKASKNLGLDRLSRPINARFHGQFGKLERQTTIPKFLASREAICISLPKRYPVTRVSLLYVPSFVRNGEQEGRSPPPPPPLWTRSAPRRWKIRRRLIETPSLQTGRVGKEDYRERRAGNFTRRDV